MSTYLVALIIGEFDRMTGYTDRGIKVIVNTAVNEGEKGKFALDMAIKELEFYEKYYEIYYPLPKCDLLAIPDFSAGAMENWGALTFRETMLLIDPKNSSVAMKKRVSLCTAHEIAHQV